MNYLTVDSKSIELQEDQSNLLKNPMVSFMSLDRTSN